MIHSLRGSPLLFILSLEPFIRIINANISISGFRVLDREFKVAAYADDLLFFLTNPHITLPNLTKTFSQYSYISNLKINYSKPEAMNVSLPDSILKSPKENPPFKWDHKTLKYL